MTMTFIEWLTSGVVSQLTRVEQKVNTLTTDINRIETKIDALTVQGAKMAGELDDLKAAVSGVVASVQQATTDIDAAINKLMQQVATGVDPAEVEAQAQAIKSANDAMQVELGKLESTLNPPTPNPTPNP